MYDIQLTFEELPLFRAYRRHPETGNPRLYTGALIDCQVTVDAGTQAVDSISVYAYSDGLKPVYLDLDQDDDRDLYELIYSAVMLSKRDEIEDAVQDFLREARADYRADACKELV